MSQSRLRGLLKRLQQSPDILRQYDAVIREQIDKGIFEIVAEPNIGKVGKVHYIPHHPVIRLNKATTKLRVVYDASARSNGLSLNDCQHKSQSFDFDLARAEIYWINILQESLLKENKFSQWKQQFGMFVDNEGLWRCKGRLGTLRNLSSPVCKPPYNSSNCEELP